jgi:hypothetical protein
MVLGQPGKIVCETTNAGQDAEEEIEGKQHIYTVGGNIN